MYYVYLLRSKKDSTFYIGYTTNLKARFDKHNNREVISTRNKVPWELLFSEAFISKEDAKNREVYLKSGWGRRSLNKIIVRTLSE